MRRGLVIVVVAGILALCSTQKAKADIIFEYSLTGVKFSDGGTVTGSFSWDQTKGRYFGVNITTTAGSLLGGDSYGKLVSPSDTRLELAVLDGQTHKSGTTFTSVSDLTLFFASSLNDGASTVGFDIAPGPLVSSEAIFESIQSPCSQTDCPSPVTTMLGSRNVTDGMLTLRVIDLVGTPPEVLPTFATVDDVVAAATAPEPSSLLLLSTGLLGLAGMTWRKKLLA